MNGFVQKFQLEKTFITKIEDIKFGSQINPKKFYGRLSLEKFKKFREIDFLYTNFNFWDDNGGNAKGDILLARIQ